MVAIIAVLEFPPKLSFKSLKTYNSFLKLYIHFLVTRITFLVRVKKTYNYMCIIQLYHSVLWKNFIYCPWCWQNYQLTLIYMYIYTQCTHQVRTESRYGIKDFFFLAPMMDCSEREEMTFPRVNRDLFMLAPSCMKIRNKYTSKVYIW